jgi:hypothetical protein
MFFLQGPAILAAVTLITFVPLKHLIDLLFGENYFHAHIWPKGFCLLIAVFIAWVLGRYYYSTPRENRHTPVRTLLFGKMGYWGVSFTVITVILILLR